MKSKAGEQDRLVEKFSKFEKWTRLYIKNLVKVKNGNSIWKFHLLQVGTNFCVLGYQKEKKNFGDWSSRRKFCVLYAKSNYKTYNARGFDGLENKEKFNGLTNEEKLHDMVNKSRIWFSE